MKSLEEQMGWIEERMLPPFCYVIHEDKIVGYIDDNSEDYYAGNFTNNYYLESDLNDEIPSWLEGVKISEDKWYWQSHECWVKLWEILECLGYTIIVRSA